MPLDDETRAEIERVRRELRERDAEWERRLTDLSSQSETDRAAIREEIAQARVAPIREVTLPPPPEEPPPDEQEEEEEPAPEDPPPVADRGDRRERGILDRIRNEPPNDQKPQAVKSVSPFMRRPPR